MTDVREFALSTGKKVEMGKMNMAEFIKVQDLMGSAVNETKMAFVLAMSSVKSIDGAPVLPMSNQVAFDGVASRFNLEEGFELVGFYAQLNPQPVGDELKNESSAPN